MKYDTSFVPVEVSTCCSNKTVDVHCCVRDRETIRALVDWVSLYSGIFTGQVKPRGSGRVGSGQLTRPDPQEFRVVLTRRDSTRRASTREI